MKREFKSPEDVRQALDGCVLFNKKQNMFVWCRSDYENVISYSLQNGDAVENINANDLDYTLELPLGFCNYTPKSLFYLVRTPRRQFKFGLTENNIEATLVPAANPNEIVNFALNVPPIGQMLSGEYPNFEEVEEYLKEKDGRLAIAFSRVFAVSRDEDGLESLHYKSNTAGWRLPGTNTFKISNNFSASQVFKDIIKQNKLEEVCEC